MRLYNSTSILAYLCLCLNPQQKYMVYFFLTVQKENMCLMQCPKNESNRGRYLKASAFQQWDLVIQVEVSEAWNELCKPDHIANYLIEALLELLPAILRISYLSLIHWVFSLQQHLLPFNHAFVFAAYTLDYTECHKK